MLNWVEHKKSFITLGPGLSLKLKILSPINSLGSVSEGASTTRSLTSDGCSVKVTFNISKICSSIHRFQKEKHLTGYDMHPLGPPCGCTISMQIWLPGGFKVFSCSTQLCIIFPLSWKCWHFNIYEQENSILDLFEPEKAAFLNIFILISI